MNQKGKKSIVDALVNVAESKNDCVKDSSKKISLSFRSKVKQGSSFLFKSVRTAVRSTSPIKKEVTISDLLTSTEISGSMNDVIIPSIEVDRISHLKRVKQVVKEALFGKGNQASLNQVPSEKLVLEKQSSMLQYLQYVRNAIFFHFYLLTTRPVFYAFTYPIQMGVLLALLGSIIINVSKFLYPALLVPPTQVTTSDSISEIESQDSVQWKAEINEGETQVNRTQVVGYDATSKVNEIQAKIDNATIKVNEFKAKIHDAETKSIHAEAEFQMSVDENDWVFAEGQRSFTAGRVGHPTEQKQASFLEIGPPGAQASPLQDDARDLIVETVEGATSVLKSILKDSATIQMTEDGQKQFFNLFKETMKQTLEAHFEVVRAKDDLIQVIKESCHDKTNVATLTTELACEKGFDDRCDLKMSELARKVEVKDHTTIETQATNECMKGQAKISEVQNILQSDLCTSKPSLCLDHLKNLLPIQGGYPQHASLWQKFKNIFTK